MRKLKCLISAALALCMLFGLAGCGSETTWIAEYNSEKTPSGLYIYYMLQAYSQAQGKVSDSSKNVLSQNVEDTPAASWIVTQAQEQLKTYYAIEQQYNDRGLTLSEDDKVNVQKTISYYWTNLSATYEKNGVSEDSFTLGMMNNAYKDALFSAIYGKGGEKEVPDDEIKSSFINDYVSFMYISFPKSDDVTTQASYDSMLDQYWKRSMAGEDFETLVMEFDNDAYGSSSEKGSNAVVIKRDSSSFPADVITALDKMADKDVTKVVTDEYTFLIQKLDLTGDSDQLEKYRDSILADMKGDEFEQTVLDWAAQISPNYNQAALKRYTPNRLKMS